MDELVPQTPCSHVKPLSWNPQGLEPNRTRAANSGSMKEADLADAVSQHRPNR